MILNRISSRLSPIHGGFLVYRSISTSSVNNVRKLVVEETENATIVKGVEIESDRKESLIKVNENHNKACPLCRLNLKNLNYSDILITGQFLNSNGKMMSKEETQLCNRQYSLVSRLIYQAQQCRLLPRPDNWPQPAGTYDEMNSYFMFPYKKRDNPWTMVQEKYWK